MMKSEFKTIAERLRFLRQLAKLTRAEISEKYQLSAATLKSWENGQIVLTKKSLARCRAIYNQENILFSDDWLMKGEGLSPKIGFDFNRYLSDDASHGKSFRCEETAPTYLDSQKRDDAETILREVHFFKSSADNAVVFFVNLEEMAPTYDLGDYVGGFFRTGKDIDDSLNLDCIIRLTSGEILFRRLSKKEGEKTYQLSCLNPLAKIAHPVLYDQEVEATAPIVWHRKLDNKAP